MTAARKKPRAKRKSGSDALTAKQARFVEEFLVDLNATQAAIRAGYSVKTARSIGFENMTKPDIVVAIEAAQEARRERLGVTIDSISRDLDEDRKLAHRIGQAGAAVSATSAKAKLHGLMTEKHEVKGRVTFKMDFGGGRDETGRSEMTGY